MTHYIINVRATQDLSEISEYLAATSLERSDRFLQDFDRKCVQIVNFPLSIEIMRVVSSRRDLVNLFDRLS
jgi:plasmid stabilization system protein ParE